MLSLAAMFSSHLVFWATFLLLSVNVPGVALEFINECEVDVVNVTVEFSVRSSLPHQQSAIRYDILDTVSGRTQLINSPEINFTGALFRPVNDLAGCNMSAYDLPPNKPWIALVQRGICSFHTKGQSALMLGAKGIIMYEQNTYMEQYTYMNDIPEGKLAITISNDVGLKYVGLLENYTDVYVTLTREVLPSTSSKPSNVIPLVLACIMCPLAIILNAGALFAIMYHPEKLKPHLYLIINLVVTDLLTALVGTALIFLLYPKLTGNEESSEYTEVYVSCIADVLTEIWDLAMFSNLFTLLILTVAHFIAFRWPMKHKIVVTKQRLLVMIFMSWLLSSAPLIGGLVYDAADVSNSIPQCYNDKGFCWKSYYNLEINPRFSWVKSLVWVIAMAVVFMAMVTVYGYILYIVHKVSQRNPGFRKKRTAIVTAIFLVISFFLTYILYFIQHFYAATIQRYDTELLIQVRNEFASSCPACSLIVDYLITGMVGAILDPLIYCVRMKEVKMTLGRLCKNRLLPSRKRSFTSSYTRAPQNSTTVDVTDENL